MPSESGRRALIWVLVAFVVVLAATAAVLVLGGPGSNVSAPDGGDPAGTLDEALSEGVPVYVLIHSAT